MAKKITNKPGANSSMGLDRLLTSVKSSKSIKELLDEVKPASGTTDSETPTASQTESTAAINKTAEPADPVGEEGGKPTQPEPAAAQEDFSADATTDELPLTTSPAAERNEEASEDEPDPAPARRTTARRKSDKGSFEEKYFKKNEKPGNLKVLYTFPRTHALLDMVTRYAKLKGHKTTLQDVVANLVEEFVQTHRDELKSMRDELDAATRDF